MDARETDSLGFPIDTAVCFSDHKGQYKKGIQDHQMKLPRKAAPLLRTLLRPGERVLLTAPACSPIAALELITTGWVIHSIKRCQLVITDRRILELPTRLDMTPRASAVEIEHSGIVEAKVSTFMGRRLRLQYRGGRTDEFTQLDAKVTSKLKAVLPPLVSQAPERTRGGRQHLCIRCAGRLRAVDRCPQCFLEFKTREKARRYALLFPGGGYFYTGHPFLGTSDGIAELIMLVVLLASLADVIAGRGFPNSLVALVTFAVALVIEKAISLYHAQQFVKGYLPAESDITPVKAA